MSINLNNDQEIDYVAQTLLELENAYELRSQHSFDEEEYFWANQAIEELNIELELQRLR